MLHTEAHHLGAVAVHEAILLSSAPPKATAVHDYLASRYLRLIPLGSTKLALNSPARQPRICNPPKSVMLCTPSVDVGGMAQAAVLQFIR